MGLEELNRSSLRVLFPTLLTVFLSSSVLIFLFVFQIFLWQRNLDLKHSGIVILHILALKNKQRYVIKIHTQMD